jgi:beta-lactamase class A
MSPRCLCASVASAEAREAPRTLARDQGAQAFMNQGRPFLLSGHPPRFLDELLVEIDGRSHASKGTSRDASTCLLRYPPPMPYRALFLLLLAFAGGCRTVNRSWTLDYDTPVDPALQSAVEALDARLRETFAMTTEQTAVGVLDLRKMRLAMIHPDRIEYAASVPKVGILLAWFQLHPEAATTLDPTTRHELGLMAKASSNEMAAKFSRAMGLREIQQVLNAQGFYDAARGGGIWVGKHYGPNSERIGDPVADHSHAATVRQLLRFWLLLEQRRLVSPAASDAMRAIFESPAIPHDDLKFVRGLAGRDVDIIRKWGSWQDWKHDSAVIRGPGRHYVLVALTKHPRGDEYLAELAREVDDLLRR